jgi:hypothetical protein
MRLDGFDFRTWMLTLGLVCAVVTGASRDARAGEGPLAAPAAAAFVVACANGANYVLQSDPVTFGGDVVTGRFFLSPRHAVHVRLIPMGQGYRYAGRGLWLDGIRNQAVLFLHKNRPIACNIGLAA